jgi:hypothetical protein
MDIKYTLKGSECFMEMSNPDEDYQVGEEFNMAHGEEYDGVYQVAAVEKNSVYAFRVQSGTGSNPSTVEAGQ